MRRYSAVACVDFETYFDAKYSLRAKDVSTTSYIRDPRFKAHCVGIQLDTWDRPRVYCGADIAVALARIDWSRTAFLAHHTHFDGLIATHHYGIVPAFWLDTLSMSAVIFGTDVSHSHKALSERLGIVAKANADILNEIKGVADPSLEQLKRLARYNGDDVAECMANYRKLVQAVPEEELRIIDLTVRMYTEPTLELDEERVERALNKEVEKKADAFEKIFELGADHKTVGSADKLAAALRGLGVEPPTKISPRTGLQAYAFAKNDLEFQALALHQDERVRALVDARLRSKSGLLESRSRRILGYAGNALPIYLKYWAARTGRWGGGDKVNWQNLPRRGDGVELRRSLCAPEGFMLVISDASQIEARLNAWDAGQEDVLAGFIRGDDLYIVTASGIYRKPLAEITEDERFLAKVLTLGCGYGAGHVKINMIFKTGQMGPAINQTIEETKELVDLWRAANNKIVAKWKRNYQEAQMAFLSQTTVESSAGVTYEWFKGDGFMHLPGGTYIRYTAVNFDHESRQLYYMSKEGPTKLYGGLLTENKIQALARRVLVEQMLRMQEELPDARLATTTHDEVVLVVPAHVADEYQVAVKQIMSTTPAWAQGLPLNAKTEVHPYYNKS